VILSEDCAFGISGVVLGVVHCTGFIVCGALLAWAAVRDSGQLVRDCVLFIGAYVGFVFIINT